MVWLVAEGVVAQWLLVALRVWVWFFSRFSACSGGRIVSWIIYCWLVWCERKTLFPAGNLRSFTSKRTGCMSALMPRVLVCVCIYIYIYIYMPCSLR